MCMEEIDMGHRSRNIKVTYKINGTPMFPTTQWFVDWWDFADWLKQEVRAKREVIISNWVYEDRLL